MEQESVAAIFAEPEPSKMVLTVDGFGVSVTVSRGHLVIRDGIGVTRRERRLTRAQRLVRRIIISAQTGYVSLEAVRWCAAVGISIVQLDPEDGLVLHTVGRVTNDARIRRAQAAAASSQVGLNITKALLGTKIQGQANVVDLMHQPRAAATIRRLRDSLSASHTLRDCRDIEATASNIYFGIWSSTVTCQFAQRDAEAVPSHWHRFATRSSPLHRGGRSPRRAADPINAMLNYSYALAEAESRIAAVAVGLDPGIGIVHTDAKNRESLALDLLETLRPLVEGNVMRLLQVRHFRRSHFHETRDGNCRLLPALTPELASHMPGYSREVGRWAEFVAHALAASSPGKIEMRTPLTRNNTRAAQQGGTTRLRSEGDFGASPMPSCRVCGVRLASRKRQLCAACWSVTRREFAEARVSLGLKELAESRAKGLDPSNTPAAAAKRSASLSRRKSEEAAWNATHRHEDHWTTDQYKLEILPRLGPVALDRIAAATGLSISACSRIRGGHLLPHRRHWNVLAALGGEVSKGQ